MLGLQIDSNALAETVAQSAVNGAHEKLTMFQVFMKGGVVLFPILILFFVTIYIIVERYLAIKRSMAVDRGQVFTLHGALKKGDMDTAMNICKGSDFILLKILGAGVERLGAPAPEIDGAMSSYGNVLIGRISGRLNYLGIIAGVAPMLGFIGTILGIINIFYKVSESGKLDIANISGGLYQKMITSCAGLVVGMIAYAGMHLLHAMIDRFSVNVEAESYAFMNLLHQPVHEA
jgi:biopolymer transport protein ExbB